MLPKTRYFPRTFRLAAAAAVIAGTTAVSGCIVDQRALDTLVYSHYMEIPALSHRYDLFKRRAGLDNPDRVEMDVARLAELLGDDGAFNRFLRDDEFAVAKLEEIVLGHSISPDELYHPNPAVLDLGPVYLGITPGTGS